MKEKILSYKKEIRINGVRITRRFTRKTDADKWYLEKRREKELVESGLKSSLPQQDLLFEAFAESWLKRRQQNWKPYSSWLSDKERLHKWLLPKFGGRDLKMISSSEFETFLDCLVSGKSLSASTRNRIRALLHKMYVDAIRLGLTETNPISRVPLWKENTQNINYWPTIEECRAYLVQACSESPRFYTFAILALNTGARISEILALQNQDVDLNHRRFFIGKIKEAATGQVHRRTKGGIDRWLGINDEVFAVLQEHRRSTRFNKPGDFVVANDEGESSCARSIRGIHKRVCKRAGVKVIRIHDLRHTFASHYVMNGGSLNDLQALLGHSSPLMTQRYAHLAPGYLATKAKVVSIGVSMGNVTALIFLLFPA